MTAGLITTIGKRTDDAVLAACAALAMLALFVGVVVAYVVVEMK
jgi:flagellar motor component MotA